MCDRIYFVTILPTDDENPVVLGDVEGDENIVVVEACAVRVG